MSGGLIRLSTLLARVCLSLIFLFAAYGMIRDFERTVADMTTKGVPAAKAALVAALVMEIGGALLLLLGHRARLGAWVLILFLAPVTVLYHNFWSAPTPAAGTVQAIQFLKNLAIMGGLLLVGAYGGGPLGLDARRRR